MELREVLRSRRSTRKFTAEQISPEELAEILTYANIAPIGSNRYKDIQLTVIQNRTVLDVLSQASVKRLEDKAKMREIIGEMKDVPGIDSQKVFDPFYGAPTVILVSHRKQTIQPGIEFSNVAIVAYTMHLAATDLGLGSVLIWGVLEAMREIPELDNTAVLELPDEFEPLIGVALGHPEASAQPRELDTKRLKTVQFTMRFCGCQQGDSPWNTNARCPIARKAR